MHLCVDARSVYRDVRRGIGKNLVDLYSFIADARADWQITMLHRGESAGNPLAGYDNIYPKVIDIKGGWLGLWGNLRLPFELLKSGANLFHAPANIGPFHPCQPMVSTIHDLIPLDPQLITPESEKWGERVRRTARVSKKIITPSVFSKRQIVDFCKVPDDKVVVNYWAPDHKIHRVVDSNILGSIRSKYNLAPDKKYVFGFGAEDSRKNTERVLIAWSQLPQSVRSECQLLLVGIQNKAREKFQQFADHLQLDDSVRLYGFADEEDIAPLLSGASVLVFPSLSEGFGLPILDAFVCGSAVLTSNVTSLPEVAGDAALLVDPTSVGAIADGLRQLLTDESLHRQLVEGGTERVKQFTWDACAQRVISVFEEVAS